MLLLEPSGVPDERLAQRTAVAAEADVTPAKIDRKSKASFRTHDGKKRRADSAAVGDVGLHGPVGEDAVSDGGAGKLGEEVCLASARSVTVLLGQVSTKCVFKCEVRKTTSTHVWYNESELCRSALGFSSVVRFLIGPY